MDFLFFYSRSGFIVPEVSVDAVHRTPAGRPTVLRRLVREKACPIQGLLAGSIKRQRDSKTISLPRSNFLGSHHCGDIFICGLLGQYHMWPVS